MITTDNSPKLVAEMKFNDISSLYEAIGGLYAAAGLKWPYVCPVKTFSSEDNGYAQVARLWEGTLTDGSKVYELHLL